MPAQALRAACTGTLRVGRGAFALPDAPLGLATAVRLGGVASHATAATLHGLGPWRQHTALHVTVPAGSRQPVPGVRIHRARLGPDDVDAHRPLTAPLRTVLDCGRVLPLVEAVVVIDAALHQGAVRLATLRVAAEAGRGHGAAGLRRAVRFADELAGSPLESVLRLLLAILDCEVRSQVRVRGVGVVDFLLDGWLVIEADGFAFHSDRGAYRTDRRRGNALAERGFVLLRFTYEDLRDRPGWVLQQVARVLSAGPATGGRG